jgi:ribosomal protein L37AE/L43A
VSPDEAEVQSTPPLPSAAAALLPPVPHTDMLHSEATSSSGRFGADLQLQQFAARLAPYRLQDKYGVQCYKCGAKLGKITLNARHHCRSCGEVFCGACSSHRMSLPLPGEEYSHQDVRVCDFCFEHLEQSDQNSLLRYFFILKSSDLPEAAVKAQAAAQGILLSLRSPVVSRSDKDTALQELVRRVGGLPIFLATLIRSSYAVTGPSTDLEGSICSILLDLILRSHIFLPSPSSPSTNPLLDAALGAGAVRFALACAEQPAVALVGASLLEELVNRDQRSTIFHADTSDDIVFKIVNLLVASETQVQIKLLSCLVSALSKSTRVGTWIPGFIKGDAVGVLHGLVLGSSIDLASAALLALVILLSALRDRDMPAFQAVSVTMTDGPLVSKIVALISSELNTINSGQSYTFCEPTLIKRTLSLLEVLSANPAVQGTLINLGVFRAISDLLAFFVKTSRGIVADEPSDTIHMMVVHSLRLAISLFSESQNREAFASSSSLPQSTMKLALESSNPLVKTTALELLSLLCIYPLFGDLLCEVPGSFEKLSVLISSFIKENAATESDVSLGISMLTFVLHYASVRAGVPGYASSSNLGAAATDVAAFDDLFLFQQLLQDSSLLSMCAKILSGTLDVTTQQQQSSLDSLFSNALWCRAAMRVARYIHVLASTVHLSLAPIFWPIVNSFEIPKLISNLLVVLFKEYPNGFANNLELSYLSEFCLAALGSMCGGAPFTPWVASMYTARAAQNAPKVLPTAQAEKLVTARELLIVAEERIKLLLYNIDPDPYRARIGIARPPMHLNTIQLQNAKSWKVYEQNASYSMANIIDSVVYRGITGTYGIKVSVMAIRLAWALMRRSVLRPPSKSAGPDDSGVRSVTGFASLIGYCDPLSRLLVFQAMPSLMSIIETPLSDLKLLIESACVDLPNQSGIFVSAVIAFLDSCSMNVRAFPFVVESLLEHLTQLLDPSVFISNEYVDSFYLLQTLLGVLQRLATVEDFSLRLVSSDLVPTLMNLLLNMEIYLKGQSLNENFRKVHSSSDVTRGLLLRSLSSMSLHDSCKFSLLAYDIPHTLFEYIDKKYLSSASAVPLPRMIRRIPPVGGIDSMSEVCLQILGSFGNENNQDHAILDVLYALASVDHVSIGNAFAFFSNSIKFMFAIYGCGSRIEATMSAKAFFVLLRGGFVGVPSGAAYDFMEFDSLLSYPWDIVEESKQLYFLFDIINCKVAMTNSVVHSVPPLFVPNGWMFDINSLLHLHSLSCCVFRRILSEYVRFYPTAIAAPIDFNRSSLQIPVQDSQLIDAVTELCSDYRLLDILEGIALQSAEASCCLGDLFEFKGIQFRMTSPRFLNTLFDLISSHSYLICNAGIRIAAAALVWSPDSRILVMTMISPMSKVVSQRADLAIEQSVVIVDHASSAFSFNDTGSCAIEDESHVMASYRTLVSGLVVMSALRDENDNFRRISSVDDCDPNLESIAADVESINNCEEWMAQEAGAINNVSRGLASILKIRNQYALFKSRNKESVDDKNNNVDEVGKRLWFMLKGICGYKSCVPILCSSGCISAVLEVASSSALALLADLESGGPGETPRGAQAKNSFCGDALQVILAVLKTMDLTAVSIIAERPFVSVAIRIIASSCPKDWSDVVQTSFSRTFCFIYSLTCRCLSQLSSISEQLNHLLLSIEGLGESIQLALQKECDTMMESLQRYRSDVAIPSISSVTLADVVAPQQQMFASVTLLSSFNPFMHLMACWNNSLCSIPFASPDMENIIQMSISKSFQKVFEKCCYIMFKFGDVLDPRFVDTAASFIFNYSKFVLKCLRSDKRVAAALDPDPLFRSSVLVALRLVVSTLDLSSLHQVR